ncbi:Dam family site-specific DNA-(adenine-N6)-methyltransferase [Macrococcoides caseolyticum]|uniref:Dam family site-specific DNA-(adenine-N6)-methyltransferase n=1 Tax=Macrococcoides caseolyticum TaxID=69966 RepID=UPI000C321204|nr:Dam family site-specific DNA-(adenine-N6)-methyltransferase [Macrococcus caseolyticus]PKE62278.1 DNA adenine methylase [Macrococcus caseolyticus]
MRYIGNKENILNDIQNLLNQQELLGKQLIFFDAFCGTGTVSKRMSEFFDIKINDSLSWCTSYTRGRLVDEDVTFSKLGFDPIEYLNNDQSIQKGFIYNNYSPAKTNRMYFSENNAGRIDFFRSIIEEWYSIEKINYNEYSFLLACLIESVSKVANTAGVYGAFLKHWDNRALKPIEFIEPSSDKYVLKSGKLLTCYNQKIEDIISTVDCDILYLDPPYTQNQYGTQYHLLETLVLNDNPSISKITGSRPTGPMRSDWSKEYKSHILLDKVVAETKAKYILMSYSSDGIMSKSFIEAVLKRYGKKETYICKKINYKKYRNFKTKSNKDHYEYLFFIEKKELSDIVYESPLNYIGSKAKMVSDIKSYIPNDISCFYDIFGGGFNVGINIEAKSIVYNDLNRFVVELIKSFQENDTYKYIMFMKKIIKKYNLKPSDNESYKVLREYYNNLSDDKKDPRLLFTLILYGYNQQIRFNNNHEFNNPVGMRWFNDKVLEKMISFSRIIKEKNIIFLNKNYIDFTNFISSSDFVYLDPPYLNTLGSYNDGKRGFKGWSLKDERELLGFLDENLRNNNKFLLSYVIKHKGIINETINEWINTREVDLIKAKPVASIKREEIYVVNKSNNR